MGEPAGWRAELSQLIADGFAAVDSRGTSGVGVPCTNDFTFMAGPVRMSREQFDAFMAERAGAAYETRHCFSNLRLVEEGPDTVTVAFTVTAHRRSHGEQATEVLVGDYCDVWVWMAGGWRLSGRTITPAFGPMPS